MGIACIFVALIMLTFGALGPTLVDSMIQKGIDAQTIVTGTDCEAYSTFVDSGEARGVIITFDVTFFNLTNPSEVLQGGKPDLTEVGPYHYIEHRRKVNLTFNQEDDGDTVSFILHKYYVWDTEANRGSGLSDTADRFTNVNPVALVLMEQLKDLVETAFGDDVVRNKYLGMVPGLQKELEKALDPTALWEMVYKLVLCKGNAEFGVSPFMTQTPHGMFWG